MRPMKISIVGGGNMGGAIARGLSTCDLFRPQDITVINRRASKTAENIVQLAGKSFKSHVLTPL